MRPGIFFHYRYVLITVGMLFLLVPFGMSLHAAPLSFRLLSSSTQSRRSVPRVMEFRDSFDQNLVLEEVGSMAASANVSWWLSSGGRFISANSIGATLQGELPDTDPWRLAYVVSNPVGSDNGYHPQNIFRIVTKSQWTNESQEVYFRIRANNLSTSPDRNSSNGVFLMNRYQDQYSLYYVGLRVDGAAVVKKKLNGVYTTLGYQPVFSGVYDRDTNPNLLPKDTWLGLKSVVSTDKRKRDVTLQVFIDTNRSGIWVPVMTVSDPSAKNPILNQGFAGMRTDFMDVEFDGYSIREL